MNAKKNHSVIVVAEGAGQDLFKDLPVNKDDSGNIVKYDIGVYLKNIIKEILIFTFRQVNDIENA